MFDCARNGGDAGVNGTVTRAGQQISDKMPPDDIIRAGPQHEPYLVLIVDDEVPIAQSLAEIIEDAGYTPMVAFQGREALKLVQGRWPALIFTDLMMPQMNGETFIAALRNEASERGVQMPPVVVLTAAPSVSQTQVMADVVVQKPFDLQHIETILTDFLGPPPANHL
jgi:CheY-like chemotaxis protein